MARAAVDAALAGRLPDDRLWELRLLVSELVTNAVRYGVAREGGVELRVTVGDGVARVEVTDGGEGFAPPAVPPCPEEAAGWGLVVVDHMASRWGVADGPETCVWAELALDALDTSGGTFNTPAYARNV